MILQNSGENRLFDAPPSPLQLISAESTQEFYIKRDDLVHPILEGNKYRKLKFILHDHLTADVKEIVSFGGPFSNHLLAVSQAGVIAGVKTRGYINSHHTDFSNPTLQLCIANGMEIFTCISESEFQGDKSQLVIPPGGLHPSANKGVQEIYQEIKSQLPGVTHIILPCGSGTTFAGIAAIAHDVQVIGINIMKMDLTGHIKTCFPQLQSGNIRVIEQTRKTRFGALRRELIPLINCFYDRYDIILDMVYNAKGLDALITYINNGYFPQDAQIVYVHTGGSQGNIGFNARFGLTLPVRADSTYLV